VVGEFRHDEITVHTSDFFVKSYSIFTAVPETLIMSMEPFPSTVSKLNENKIFAPMMTST